MTTFAGRVIVNQVVETMGEFSTRQEALMYRWSPGSKLLSRGTLFLICALCATSAVAQEKPQKIPNEFFVLNEDGTGWKSLYRFPGGNANGSVSVSPDGKAIAFDSWPGEKMRESSIYIKELEGGEPRKLCSGMMPTWSKEGRFLTCSRYEPVRGVWLIEIDGEEREHLCTGWGAQWSPDGRKIAFSEGAAVTVFDIVKDEFQTILEAGQSPYRRVFFNMAWSPDSEQICLKGVKPDGTEEIATLRSVGGKPVLKVHHSVNVEVHPDFAWHPKGDRIVCAIFCPERGVTQLYDFNPEKDDPPQLVKGQDETRNNTDSTWTHDGKTLIVVSGDF
ncbi:hypothetical protein [Schlesneria sp. T3-172]|uniref:hypothetical protein n=1 Tax=Schlesneria sphaerica TaxID=3373610 RepID=UPI0037CB5859